MKKTLFLCFLPVLLQAQITITDDFTDSNFTANPNWLGDTAIFQVSGNKQLQLNDTAAGEAYLYLKSAIAENATWEFEVKMEFNPSASNYCRIYLMSDQPDLSGTLNGYYVRVGGSSADRLSLYRQDGTSSVLLTESADDYLDVSMISLRCRVSLTNGNWSLEADTGLLPDPMTILGSAIDSTYKTSAFFGVNPHYTVTRANRFFFDNFQLSGTRFIDSLPPRLDSVYAQRVDVLQVYFNEAIVLPAAEDELNYEIEPGVGSPVQVIRSSQDERRVDLELPLSLSAGVNYQLKVIGVKDSAGNSTNDSLLFSINNPPLVISELTVLNSTTLELSFNDDVTQGSAENTDNYQVSNGIGQPAVAQQNPQEANKVTLVFSSSFQNRTSYELQVSGLVNDFGNTLDSNVYFTFFIPEEGSVIINEIMADPNPVVGIPPDALPEREYLELYNREDVPVNLKDWTLQIGSAEEVLPFYELPPKGFVVLTKDEVAGEFKPSIPVLGLDMSSTALVNTGASLTLYSKEGLQVSHVSYTDDWYGDPNKDDGGWALEQIDPDNSCGGISNWAASVDPLGGTPGRSNSLLGQNPDTTKPAFERIAVLSDSLVQVSFTEKTDALLLVDETNYRIEPPLEILFADAQAPGYSVVRLYFEEAIDPNIIYRLSLRDYPLDCGNNQMEADTLLFTIPSIPREGDILLNEILFDPPSGGADFVELYNNSDRLFDLQYLRTSHIDPNTDRPMDVELILEESFLIEPGRYLALTMDKAFLMENYLVKYPENIVEVNRLPTMPDDEGSIAVVSSSLEIIDHYQYSEEHHVPLIDPEGVSLERLSFSGPSNDPANWQSAASTAGYATPGYRNSQRVSTTYSKIVSVEQKVFSPNQDGYHDEAVFSYNFQKPNNLLSVSIWNSSGYKVKEVVQNKNVSSQGFVRWDGTDDRGELLTTGIYIVVFDYFNTDGTQVMQKETCVLSL